MRLFRVGFVLAVFNLGLLLTAFWSGPAVAATDDWATSLHDVERTAGSADTTISTSNVSLLKKSWNFATGGPIAASPSISGGVAYFGSWDGYEYAVNASTGALIWKTFLGVTTYNPSCIPPKIGVSSPATVSNGVVYLGGGDSYWYALDAASGNVLWKLYIGDSSAAGGNYNWAGPLISNGYAYIGVASLGDCPLVQGKLHKVNLATHQIENTLKIVPDGQLGGGIWTSPALDPVTNTIFTATGTKNDPAQNMAQAFLAIDASTMAIKDHWELPNSMAVLDSDFGTSTTLFTDSQGRKLITAINKNGDAFTFLRSNLAAGPVWKQNIAGGGYCPTCGDASVSSGAFGGGRIYLGGGGGTINGQGYPGTVRALDPATGNYIWQHPTTGIVIGALAYANGVVYVSGGSIFEALDAATGQTLYSFDTGSQVYAGPSIAGGIIYTGNTAGNLYAFGLGSASQPPPDANCPAGYTCQDIGASLPAGSETVSGPSWNIQAGGGGLTGTADSFRLIGKSGVTSGDIQITAQMTSQQNSGANAQAGLILRQSNDPGAPYYAIVRKPNNTLQVQYRQAFGAVATVAATTNTGTVPQYLMIRRQGNHMQVATSTNGTTYTLLSGSDVTMVLPSSSIAGVAVSSGTNGVAGGATLASFAAGALSITPQPPAGTGACPSGWQCQDIGNPSMAGGQTLSGNTWTVSGGGSDIWGTSDQFHFVSQNLTADGTVSARVTATPTTDTFAKTGVMMRGGATAGAAFYAAYLFPDKTIHIQYRNTSGFGAQEKITVTGALPQYLRIGRSGSTFTTYTSTDGATWTPLAGSTLTIANLGGQLQTGMAVTSHNGGLVGTATLDTVTIGTTAPPPPNLCPVGWACEDIGAPTPAGDQTFSNGTWTIDSGGGDIWGTYDTFRMISQNLNGDGNVSVHLVSQSNSGEWAKAGPMVRLSNDPQAPYYAAFVTPVHGLVIQWRPTQGAATQQIQVPGTAPAYLRVGRVGTNLTAYSSTSGTTWTAITSTAQNIPSLAPTLLGGIAADSYNTITTGKTVWDNVSVNSGAVQTGLPQPWVDVDFAGTAPAGSATYTNSTFTIKGGGKDVWGTTDQANYVYQSLSGDGSLIARVTSQTNTDPWAKAGIMFKSAATGGSPYASVFITPANGVHAQANFNTDQAGSSYTFPNAWLKISREGNVFTTYQSADGINWARVGQTVQALSANATVGMFVSSHNGAALGTAAFDNVSLTPGSGGALPTPWVSTDVGQTGLPGSASFANGAYTLKGAGNDIWGTTDQFHFVSQPMTGDGSIVARETSQSNTDPWAKAGVMIKANTSSGSAYSMLATTPGNGLHMQSNFNTDQSGGTYAFPDAWLKLTRTGNIITTYKSSNGTAWTQVGTATVSLAQTAQIGLFVNAHNASAALGTAIFDNVTVTPAPNLPAGWLDADVGAPALSGSVTYANGVLTMKGAGNDIWGTVDQFHYTYKTLTGNGQVIARLASQSATDPWTKSGVMVKQSTTAGSTYALLAATPSNGTRFQSNFNTDQIVAPSTVLPIWMKLVRNGTTVTASTSADGITWNPAGSATLSLTDPITIGVYVCSHSGGSLNTSTFDNISF